MRHLAPKEQNGLFFLEVQFIVYPQPVNRDQQEEPQPELSSDSSPNIVEKNT